MLYKAHYRQKRRKACLDGPVRATYQEALQDIPQDAKAAVILRDAEGEDHPDNAGKFFLHRIIK